MDAKPKVKTAILILMLSLVTVVHYIPTAGFFGAHIFHRELFFFPIVLTGLWFGLKAALAMALAAGIAYAHFFLHTAGLHATSAAVVGLQVAGFILMAALTGSLVDRQKRQQQERDFLNETFGRYVSKEIRDEILGGRVSLKGEVKEVTVLFADLRDFSKLVETIAPRDVVAMINTYFQSMSEAIVSHNGLVVQFVGDEIEAVFGAPVALENHRQHAVNAALEMRNRLSQVNLDLSKQGFPPLRHGIGLHSGKVVAANIGSSHRISYALVGETVNIASRIQDQNKDFGTDILMSDAVHQGLDMEAGMRPQGPVFVKGIGAPLHLYSIERRPLV